MVVPRQHGKDKEILEGAKCRVLMGVIGRIIARHNSGDCRLDEGVFKLFEIAKTVNRANSSAQLLRATSDLKDNIDRRF